MTTKQLFATFILLAGGCAFAAEPTDTLVLGEVSVTAIKQARQLQTEPVASTTVGAQAIERLNITDIKQVSELTPNFFIPAYGSRMTSSIYVRGLGARIDQPAMGLNVDNIPVLNKNDYDFDFFNIERIEILRGPQSTLYGRNTMGGLINVYTLSPMRYQGLRLLMETASFATWRAAMGLYHKFTPKFALGVDINAYSTRGQTENLWVASKWPMQKHKADQAEQYSGKLKLAWLPKPNVTVDNVLSYSYNRQGGYPYELMGSGVVNYNDTCYYNRYSASEGLTVQWRAKDFTFSSITGLRAFGDELELDNDFTPDSYFTLNQKIREYSATQDFIFRGSKGNYSWMAGAFGFVKHTKMTAPVKFQKDGIDNLILANIPVPLTWDSESFYLHDDFTLPNYGAAIYHQSEYTLGDWSFAAGLRLDYEHAAMTYELDTSTGASFQMGPRQLHLEGEVHEKDRLQQHWLQVLPKLTVTYRIPSMENSNVYLNVSKGYKAGGYNTQMFSTILQDKLTNALMASAKEQMPPQVSAMMPTFDSKFTVEELAAYKPEFSWNYEIGGHFSCMQGRILTDVAAFYIDIRDQQLTVFPDGSITGRMMTNAGRTRSAGAELAVTALPTDRWTARASYGYTNAKFLRYDDGGVSYKGKTVPYAPAHTAFASVQYSQPLKMWWFNRIDIEVNGRGVGPMYWNEANTERQDFYALLGASVRLQLQKVSLDIWGENILNQRYETFYFRSINNDFIQRGSRRTFGMTLRYIM